MLFKVFSSFRIILLQLFGFLCDVLTDLSPDLFVLLANIFVRLLSELGHLLCNFFCSHEFISLLLLSSLVIFDLRTNLGELLLLLHCKDLSL